MSNGSKDGIRFILTPYFRFEGYEHNPAYYFTQQSDSVETAMDLVMMCNGWRRFKWEELAKGNSTTTYHDPGYIQVAGSIFKSGTKKLFVSKPFLIFITGKFYQANANGCYRCLWKFQIRLNVVFWNYQHVV